MAGLLALENSTEKPFGLCFAARKPCFFNTCFQRSQGRQKVQARSLLKSFPASDSAERLWVRTLRLWTLSQGRSLHPQEQDQCGAAWARGMQIGNREGLTQLNTQLCGPEMWVMPRVGSRVRRYRCHTAGGGCSCSCCSCPGTTGQAHSLLPRQATDNRTP